VWTVAVCLFYTVFGFLILPLIVRAVAVKQLSKQLDRKVTLRQVRINPYSLKATIRGFLIKDTDGETLVSWDEVRVNFQFSSLFSKAWVFKDVTLLQPFVRVQINKDYTLNFSDIAAKFSKPGQKGKASAFRINRLFLIGAKASFTDLTPREPFQRIIGPFEVTLANFRSDSDSKNPYVFSGVTDGGEQFSWRGFFYLNPLRSEGEFRVNGVSLLKYAPLYQDVVRFEIKDGVIDLRATYRYERSAATNLLAVTNTFFALKSLKVAEKGTNENVIDISSLVVRGASVDAMARMAEADALTVSDGRVIFRRNKDASINAIELARPAESADTPGGIVLLLRAVTNVVAMLLNTTNLSTGIIRDFTVTNCALHLEDLVNSQPVRLDLDGIAVNAKNISNRAGTNLTAEVSMRWGTNGTIRADIQAGLAPPSAEIKLALDQLSLLPLAPYLEPHAEIFVLGGKLGLGGTLHVRAATNELPEVRFEGDAWLDELSFAERIETESLLKWNALRISGIAANLNPPVISAKELRVADAFVRLIIETNRTINLMSALRRGGSNAPSALTVTNTTATNVMATAQPKISVGSVVVSNANVHFIDRSLHPNVNILIEQLGGTVTALSSDDSERAAVNLRGTVDKTAPAEITGKLNPWNQKQPTELKLVVKDMDLLPEDPYAAKYLGYQLKKGKLSLELSHQLAEGKLKSKNRITLDHLTLGEKVASSNATTLPVRLAIAVLKDRNGRIELEVPIEGTLDDPKFQIGQVIAGAIGNVIKKVVTSPFAALSSIFGGKGEELSVQEFEPGSTNLLPATIEKLNALAKGLYERPELQLEIEGSADAGIDGDALRAGKLSKQFRLQKWESLLPAAQARISPDEMKVAPEEYAAFLSEAYARIPPSKALTERTNQHVRGNDVTSASTTEPKSAGTNNQTARSPWKHFSFAKGATALMKNPAPVDSATQLDREGSLLETIEITPADLRALALERSRNVKAYLLQTGKVEAERISVTESKSSTAAKGSRVYLRLQ
jgi:hypothetical protein